MRLAKVFSVGMAALLVVACGGGIKIPSIPPIPSFSIPPIPSNLIPSGAIPSAGNQSAVCNLVTTAEMGTLMGGSWTITSSDEDSCTYTLGLPNVVITVDTSSDLQTAHILFGDTAKDVNVGGFPAVTGVFIGQPGVYVQKGGTQLQILGVLTGSDDPTIAKLVNVAATAVARLP
jgi:hypothetical protein